MKQIIWKNKSNKQLCVTIPQNNGLKEGDILSLNKAKIKTIVYSTFASDFLHYGHLKLLQQSNELGDLHITGILTDEAIESYKEKPLTNIKERKSIISSLNCVDMTITQNSFDPTENLMKIYEDFKHPKIILILGSNWKKVPGAEFIKKIKGEVIQLPFYEKLSEQNIVQKFIKIFKPLQKNTKKEKIVYTAGTWDLFHVGHLNIIRQSRKLGDKLIVGVSTDELVKSYKNNYPTIPYEHRVNVLASCKYVDEIVKQEKLLDIEQMKKLKINVLTIGTDWKDKYLEGLDWAKKQPNMKVVFIDYTKDVSSTKIKQEIKNGITKK